MLEEYRKGLIYLCPCRHKEHGLCWLERSKTGVYSDQYYLQYFDDDMACQELIAAQIMEEQNGKKSKYRYRERLCWEVEYPNKFAPNTFYYRVFEEGPLRHEWEALKYPKLRKRKTI